MEKSLFYRRQREGDCAADEDGKAQTVHVGGGEENIMEQAAEAL